MPPSGSRGKRRHITLAQMQLLKNWHAAQQGRCPCETAVWESVLTVWLMGWIGWLPAFAFDEPWAYPLCVLAIFAPRLYVDCRLRLHEMRQLRCDWLDTLR